MLLFGGVVGWLAGMVMRGSGYGIIGDIIVGLLGAVIGSYLVQAVKLSVHIGHPLLDKAVVAFIGAVVLMFASASSGPAHSAKGFRTCSAAGEVRP